MTTETREVYNHNWRKVRKVVLERDGMICQIRGPKCRVQATCVDHVVPWRAGGPLYDLDNLRASCKSCNEERVWRERKHQPSREW